MKALLRVVFSLLFFLLLTVSFSAPVRAVEAECSPGANDCAEGYVCTFNGPGEGWVCLSAPDETPKPFDSAWTDPTCTRGPSGKKIATLQGFGCIFQNLLQIVVPLLGLATFVLLIAGGFQYLTAGGDPKQAQKASQTITTAIVGLAVVVGVWFIFQILKAITGIDLFRFTIPGK